MDGFTTHYNLGVSLPHSVTAASGLRRSLVRPEGSEAPAQALILHARPFLATAKTVPFKYKAARFYSPFKTNNLYVIITDKYFSCLIHAYANNCKRFGTAMRIESHFFKYDSATISQSKKSRRIYSKSLRCWYFDYNTANYKLISQTFTDLVIDNQK
jgi:hypothetical protein